MVFSNSFIVIGFNASELFKNLDEAIVFCKENNLNIFSFSLKENLFDFKIIGLKLENQEVILNKELFVLSEYKKLNLIKENINISLYSVDKIDF